jgi:hypothetical protein
MEIDMGEGYADRMYESPLVEVLALLDRLEASGESFDADLIRAHVPEKVRAELADEVNRLNAELREAGY